MLRIILIAASVMAIAWWVRGGDAHALRRDLTEFTAARTSFDDRAEPDDWGG